MADPGIAGALARIWEERRASFAQRTEAIDAAIGALASGALTDELRAAATREAHKLAGSLGTFGLPRGSELARGLETAFSVSPRTGRASRLAHELRALRDEIARGPSGPSAAPAREPGGDASRDDVVVVLLTADDALAERLTAEAATQGIAVARGRCAESPAVPRGCTAAGAAVVDLGASGAAPAGLEAIGRLAGGRPSLPTVVLAAEGDLATRVEVMRRGGAVFLRRGSPPAAVIAAAEGLLRSPQASQARVLVLDDDPALHDALSALLTAEAIEVASLEAPERLLETISDVRPDLVVLDVDLPTVDGIDLCRVLRSDPSFAELPVLFLTGHAEPALIDAMFASGADDYVSKPIVGPELVGRIRNRLARARLARDIADRDALTGVAGRRRATADIVQSLALADRYEQPASLVMIDLDRFKGINDRHGHAVGDAVLRSLGALLSRTFRREDTVGRWGGEEFVVCLFGARREDAVERMGAVLERFSGIELPAPAGPPVRATFSAGVAEYPADAADLQSLLRAADRALYAAKAAGRERVAPCA